METHTEYKVIHGHLMGCAAVYAWIAKKHGRKVIVHSHAVSFGTGAAAAVKNIMKFPVRYLADYRFACSKEAAEFYFGKKPARIIQNAIDGERFTFSEEKRKAVRKKYGIGDSFVVGNVSRLSKNKNHMFLLEVFKEVLKKEPGAFLLIAGSGEMEQELKKRVSKLRLDKAVIFCGAQSDTEDYYSAMDVFVLTTLREGLSMVTVEAQTSGLKCVISDQVPDGADIKAGLIRKMSLDDNAELWAQAVCEFRQYDRKEHKKELLKSGYDIRTAAKKMEKFYLKSACIQTCQAGVERKTENAGMDRMYYNIQSGYKNI